MKTIEQLVKTIREGSFTRGSKLIAEAEAGGIHIFYFSGKSIADEESFFNTAKTVMRLPGYFGYNWDAFEECINDLSWIPAQGYIFIYDNTSVFFSKHPKDAEILTGILDDARNNFRGSEISFEVILADGDDLSAA